MKKKLLVLMCAMSVSSLALADVVMLAADAGKDGHHVKLGDKAQRQAFAKAGGGHAPNATGSQTLTDASGFEFFFNTNITFATSSSASGAASEASYTASVNASTLNGGVTASTLNDGFDGYNALCISTDGSAGPCITGAPARSALGAGYTMYNQNGVASLDAGCNNRQVIMPVQNMGALSVQRKMFVPSNDEFARWLNIFTNTTGAPLTFKMITSNNLGSDSNTALVSSSDGDAVAEVTDTWVSTFQNFSGTTSTDPRLGHVLQGAGASSPLTGINFVNGDDNPYWSYTHTLAAGATVIFANFATGQPNRADANAKASELAGLPANATACMTAAEISQVANFAAVQATPSAPIPTTDRRVLAALALLIAGLGWLVLRARNTA